MGISGAAHGSIPRGFAGIGSRVFLAASGTLTACGGGGDSTPPAPAGPDRLIVVGNSIAASGLNPMWIDWTGPVRGMAASAPEKDFAHVAAAALGLPLTVTGGVDIEIRPETVTQTDIDTKLMGMTSRTYVVVELGDNALVANLLAFRPSYEQLLRSASKAGKLACLSTWWGNKETDDVMRAACVAAGGRYVYIGDLWKSPDNRDLLEGPQYTNPGVQAHPHDWGMGKIGERVAAALK